MPDETDPTIPPTPPEQQPTGGAYTQGEKIAKINVADEIKNSFLDYSMSVIISRALPDVRDGLKPSQRRILYAMENLSLFPGRKHIKCAKICGDTSGNYHPHQCGSNHRSRVRHRSLKRLNKRFPAMPISSHPVRAEESFKVESVNR